MAADQLSVLPGWPGSPPAARVPARWFAVPVGGKPAGMRFGNLEVRPLGGGLGCLFMVLFSVVASVVLTVLVNLLRALLGRRYGVLSVTLLSSGLFGLWHVLASLGGGPANAAIVGVVGGGAAGTAIRVVATVVFTTLGGVVLCWLRLRSNSLLAPVLAHWTANGLGVIVALVA